jgi:3-isopropylmalate dehydrogenase
MKKTIAVLAGDGIGEEVMEQALRVLTHVSQHYEHEFTINKGYAGGAAYDRYQTHMPQETLDLCKASDAILFGSVGGPVAELDKPKWKNCEANSILMLRKTFGFNANFRPVRLFRDLEEICPLKKEIVERGVDILFIRELLGDAYFGKKETRTDAGYRVATDVAEYTEKQVATVAHVAFKSAQQRKHKVTSVDKANVLETSRLWRTVVREVAKQYPDVTLEEMLVDNCAMQIIRDPAQFDVVVTSNMFGDILTDEAAVLAGSLGLLASASINAEGFGLYEPPGGSAQDIAGKRIANPIAQILSVALMLRFSFGLNQEARAIENAIETALNAGYRTQDIYRDGDVLVGTDEMTDHIITYLATPKLVLA